MGMEFFFSAFSDTEFEKAVTSITDQIIIMILQQNFNK